MPDVMEAARALEARFWWLRGAVAALTFAELVTGFFDLDRVTWLTGVHLVLIAWNEVCGAVGRFVGQVPFLPELTADQVNIAIFASAIALPAAAGVFLQSRRWADGNRRTAATSNVLDRAVSAVVDSFAFSALLGMLILWVAIDAYAQVLAVPRVEVSAVAIPRTITLDNVLDAEGEPVEFVIQQRHQLTTTRTRVSHWFNLPYSLALYGWSLWLFPRMRRGFVYVVGFLAASELLLAMTRLNVADWICGIAREALPGQDLPGQCTGGA